MSLLVLRPAKSVSSPLAALIAYRYLDVATTVFVVVVSLLVFTTPLRQHGDLLRYAQDDFYYYLTAARNIVSGAGSTFDGSTRTNGYHPLYELLLIPAACLFPTLRGIYGFLAILDILSSTAIFLCVRALFQRSIQNRWVTNGFALVILYLCFFKLYHQMEVTLVLPFGFLFLLMLYRDPPAITHRQWAAIGLVASLMVLSRLDTMIFVSLTGAVALLDRRYRRSLTFARAFAFLGGFAPLLLAYFLVNRLFFHLWMPISGSAKQLEKSHGLIWANISQSLSPESYVFFAVTFLTLLTVFLRKVRLPVEQKVVCLSGLMFPIVHWGLLFYLSDWKLWGWYGYGLRFSIAAVLLLVAHWLSQQNAYFCRRWRLNLIGPVGYGVALAILASARYRVDFAMAEIAVAANAIQGFAAQHPGRYAMGDRAGMVGYTDRRPTIQTEGLMMDDAFLNHIRRQEPLRSVLKDYAIDYYIGFDRLNQPCFNAREPANAGPVSPVMRGKFCEPPVAVIPTASGRTLIFALTSSPR